ncbi:protein rep, partial [Acinetobacter soli]
TPFDLLQLSIDDSDIYGKKPSKLWQEFGISMKGSRQLEWGRGLKNLYHVEVQLNTDDVFDNDKED